MIDKSLDTIYLPLEVAFGLVPILAGLDKYFGILADWKSYLSPQIASVLLIRPEVLLGVVGVIEMIVGIAILTRLLDSAPTSLALGLFLSQPIW